jgi:hypothetical protein
LLALPSIPDPHVARHLGTRHVFTDRAEAVGDLAPAFQ